jgi:Lectin C-type domain
MRILDCCAALLLVLAGCYDPFPRDGAPCERSEQCPSPQSCVLGSCSSREAPPVDAAEPEEIDAAIDAAIPIDAPRLACSTAGLNCPGGNVTMYMCGGNCWVRCTARLSRTNANTACINWTGKLGEINDATEQGCISPTVGEASWIGLTQSSTATTPGTGWLWNDAITVVYSNWTPGHPDDGDNRENLSEQCGDIRPGGAWDDDTCNQSLRFYCERP